MRSVIQPDIPSLTSLFGFLQPFPLLRSTSLAFPCLLYCAIDSWSVFNCICALCDDDNDDAVA